MNRNRRQEHQTVEYAAVVSEKEVKKEKRLLNGYSPFHSQAKAAWGSCLPAGARLAPRWPWWWPWYTNKTSDMRVLMGRKHLHNCFPEKHSKDSTKNSTNRPPTTEKQVFLDFWGYCGWMVAMKRCSPGNSRYVFKFKLAPSFDTTLADVAQIPFEQLIYLAFLLLLS